eukprot:GHRR01035386.1.p3 GENE.GHRR01035386.1~~GHRR01035386.1.p3  ORF type:complete len:101 (-),score=11.79 GHRR01035386.1:214-516(-)
MLTCLHCVDAPAMLLAFVPVALVLLPTGKQVNARALWYIIHILPKVLVSIGKAVHTIPMPLPLFVLSNKVAVIHALQGYSQPAACDQLLAASYAMLSLEW